MPKDAVLRAGGGCGVCVVAGMLSAWAVPIARLSGVVVPLLLLYRSASLVP